MQRRPGNRDVFASPSHRWSNPRARLLDGPDWDAVEDEIRDEDTARLSPFKHRNLNLLGRYSFTASVPAAGALRPLRDPDATELDEDDGGGEGQRRATTRGSQAPTCSKKASMTSPS